MGSGDVNIAMSCQTCHLALVYSFVRGFSLPAMQSFIIIQSRAYFLHPASVHLPWGKDKIPVNWLTDPFVFCGVVKLKTTSTNLLIMKGAQVTYINSAKAVCIKEKLHAFKGTFCL